MTLDAFETVAFTLCLRGSADEYRRRHDEIWPEMETALRSVGVIEYEIYLAPDGETLFAWMRRRRDHTFGDIRKLDVWKRWQGHMADLLVTDGPGPLKHDLAPMFRLRSTDAV